MMPLPEVVRATVRGERDMVAVRYQSGPRGMWLVPERPYGHRFMLDKQVTDRRPLVLIDPEDVEQVVPLARALRTVAVLDFSGVRTALRSLTGGLPTPEPGMYGVVIASCVHSDERVEWVRGKRGWNAIDTRKSEPDPWEDLRDPEVIREGVTS